MPCTQNEAAAQAEYDEWTCEMPVARLEALCGPEPTDHEKRLLDCFRPSTLIDIGCGTGSRMLPFYENRGVNYTGLEKYDRIIVESRFRDRIIRCDIGEADFLQEQQALEGKFEVATMWGGVLTGVHCADKRRHALRNVARLLSESGHFLLDTPRIDRFEEADAGTVRRFFPGAPPQYCPSLPELQTLAQDCGLGLMPEHTSLPHPVSPQVAIVYLVFRKTQS